MARIFFPCLIRCVDMQLTWVAWWMVQVLSRLAPFERGIYEDYVANFWCTTSVLIKWKRLFTTPSLKLLSFGATISACLPSMLQQIRAPSKRGFLYGLLNSAFSFYLFSFQGRQIYCLFFSLFLWKSVLHINGLNLNPQCMRSRFCCRSSQQVFWQWKSLFFIVGWRIMPCSRCFLF